MIVGRALAWPQQSAWRFRFVLAFLAFLVVLLDLPVAAEIRSTASALPALFALSIWTYLYLETQWRGKDRSRPLTPPPPPGVFGLT